MELKYGMNPYQDYAEVVGEGNNFTLVNGKPSIINVLDALNAWQLVKELKEASGKVAATSFKHVTPSGTALGGELTKEEHTAYLQKDKITSPLAAAYLRARGSDRLASFGDFIALSDVVDTETAKTIKKEVSDGVIAPGYEAEALEILKAKKGGKYVMFQINPDYLPAEIEERQVFGITIKQKRNNFKITEDLLGKIVTKNKELPQNIKDDLITGMINLKYTNSNSICLVKDGQVIGVGSGQQSRILCSGLAINKANIWRQKLVLDYGKVNFPEGAKRTDKDQIIELAREEQLGDKNVLADLSDICLCSDAFFPQKDNILLAAKFGIKYIAAPMGSIRDQEIIETCDAHGITFVDTGVRLFHH